MSEANQTRDLTDAEAEDRDTLAMSLLLQAEAVLNKYHDRIGVYLALDALAVVVAAIVRGTKLDPEAVKYFKDALIDYIKTGPHSGFPTEVILKRFQ